MKAYNQIDKQIHQLAQTISKFNRSYLEPKDNDSHTNLAFDSLFKRILGRWATVGEKKFLLAFEIKELRFVVYTNEWIPLKAIDIIGKTQEEYEKEIENVLVTLGLPKGNFLEEMHYKIPDYGLGNIQFEKWDYAAVNDWMEKRKLANEACHWLNTALQTNAEVRIWPHHFDTGIYVEPTSKLGLGFGLAMEDDLVGSPYFYLSGYGLNNNTIDYNSINNFSHADWIINDQWKGAVLKLENASTQGIRNFLKITTSWFLRQ